MAHIGTYIKFSDFLLKQPINFWKFEIVTGGMPMNQFRVSSWIGSVPLKIVPPTKIPKSVPSFIEKIL